MTNITASPKLINPASQDDGCPGGATNMNFTIVTKEGQLQTRSLAHGSLMLIGWGFLLPTGVAAGHFLKHRPNALWFKAHRVIQTCGLLVAFVGWVIALTSFDVFTTKDTSYVHGALGMTVMVIGLLQPLNAFVRPHPPEAGESRSAKRLVWEIVHKCSGYIAVVLAAVTILMGTFVIFRHNGVFQAMWGVALAWLVIFIVGSVWDRKSYKNRTVNDSVPKNDGDL